MVDPIDLLKQQQAENRVSFVTDQQQRSAPKQDLYRYVGFDAETGMAIVSNGTDTVQAGRITNGAIQPNQPVKTVRSGSRAVIDSMPSPKAIVAPTPPTLTGNIKVLYLQQGEDGKVQVVVGGWKQPKMVAEYPGGTGIAKARINNLGGDKWIASWVYYLPTGETDIVTYEGSREYRFSDTDEGKEWIASDWRKVRVNLVEGFDYGLFNYGFGMWRYQIGSYVDLVTTKTAPLKTGYWLKDKAEFVVGSQALTFVEAGSKGGSFVNNYSENWAEPILPGRFDPVFYNSLQVGNAPVISARRIEVGMIDQQLSQAYATIRDTGMSIGLCQGSKLAI